MSYFHEATLKKALERLHFMGGPDHPPQGAGSEEVGDNMQSMGASLGSFLRRKSGPQTPDAATRQRMAEDALVKKVGAEGDMPDREDIDFIKGNPWSAEKQAVAAGQALPENPYQKAQMNAQINQQAQDAPMGGLYTSQGLQQANESADVNSDDRLKARALMGQGMRMSRPDIDPGY